ncbi:MAG: LPS export ABC transporter permease LptG [Burkholderiales bacterium]|nr:LPS export ABC transporter permease LptG [Burkholderiales bacterium]MDQ3195202.1 LPS export ABC transporter permease LptG [Pseudomonadota bacterium]
MILRRYLSKEILLSTLFVFIALLLLFAFFDLINELDNLGQNNYRLGSALAYVALSVPGRVYELFPIAALIGTLFALAQLVQHSEYTVIRVSGMSIARMAFILIQLGLLFAALTFIFGEFIAPAADRAAQYVRLRATSSVIAQEFRSGLWVKDDTSFVNVARILPDATLLDIKIYEFDPKYRLRTISTAKQGDYQKDNLWRLQDVVQTHFEPQQVSVNSIALADWRSVLTPGILNVLLVVPEKMSTSNLYRYVEHLRENKQRTSRYEIALWTKISYPFAVLVMMVLALPFAHHQSRAGGIGAKIFAGIMLGLAFHLLNRLFGHLGLLNAWPPILTATAPTLLFLAAAVGMMWRIERR